MTKSVKELKITDIINTLLDVIVDHGDLALQLHYPLEIEIIEQDDQKRACLKPRF